MTNLSEALGAASHDYLIGIAPAVFGVVIVAGLIMAVRYGRRRRAQEPPPPPGRQPRDRAWQTRDGARPERPGDDASGDRHADPVGYEQATREPDEVGPVPHEERRRPHQIRPYPGPRT